MVDAPKLGRSLPSVLSIEEVEAFLNAIPLETPEGLRDRALFELIYSAGLRVSEAVGLSAGSLYLRDGIIRVTGKGSKQRVIPLGDEARKWIGRYLTDARPLLAKSFHPTDALFLSRRGTPLSRKNVWKRFKQFSLLAGVDGKVHTLRHSFATHLLAGEPIFVPFRNCLAIPISRPPRSTPISMIRPSVIPTNSFILGALVLPLMMNRRRAIPMYRKKEVSMNKKRCFLLLLLLPLLFPSCSRGGDKMLQLLTSTEREGYRDEGVDAKKIDELEKAIRRYDSDIEKRVQDTGQLGLYYRILALDLMEKKMYGPALEQFTRALDIYPANPVLFYYAGLCRGYIAKAEGDKALREKGSRRLPFILNERWSLTADMKALCTPLPFWPSTIWMMW